MKYNFHIFDCTLRNVSTVHSKIQNEKKKRKIKIFKCMEVQEEIMKVHEELPLEREALDP